MGSHFVVMLLILLQLICTAFSQPSSAAGHCNPAQEGSRHKLIKVFRLEDDDQVALATIVKSPNAMAHLELAQCTIFACQSRLAAYRATIRPYDFKGQYEVGLTLTNVQRKDGRRYLWYVNGKVKDKCNLEVFDFSSDVVCTSPRLLNRGPKELYISVSCHINMVYPKPDCIISQAKDGKIIPKNYISSQTLNTDHYNHTCTMTMMANPDRLQEYQVVMFPEKLGAIKSATRFAKFNLSLPAVTIKDCPQDWTKARWREYYFRAECNLWVPEFISDQKGNHQLCGNGSFQRGPPNVFYRFIYPRKSRSCPTGFDPVGIYFDIKIEYPASLSHVDITGFGIDSIFVGERQLLDLQRFYRIYTAFLPVPGESVAFRLDMRNPFGFRKFVECYIPFYEHCPTLVSQRTTTMTDSSTTTTTTTTTQRPTTTISIPTSPISTSTTTSTTSSTIITTSMTTFKTSTATFKPTTMTTTVPKTTTKAYDVNLTRTETTSDLTVSPNVSHYWNGTEKTTPPWKGQSVSGKAIEKDPSSSFPTMMIVGTGVAVVAVLCVVVAVVCIAVIRRQKRSKLYESSESNRTCGIAERPGAFENVVYDSSVMACGVANGQAGGNCCEAEYAEVGDFHSGDKESLAVDLPRAEENPYETMSCRP